MEKITQQEANKMIKQEKENLKKIIDEGGKVINTVIYEKNKTTTIHKVEPVNGQATSSKIVQSKTNISINDF